LDEGDKKQIQKYLTDTCWKMKSITLRLIIEKLVQWPGGEFGISGAEPFGLYE
jgi:hypothetical protein